MVAIAVCVEEPGVRGVVWVVFEGDTAGVNDEAAGVTEVVLVVVGTVEVLEALRQRGSAVQIHSIRKIIIFNKREHSDAQFDMMSKYGVLAAPSSPVPS